MAKLKNFGKNFLIYMCIFLGAFTLTAGFKVGVFFINRADDTILDGDLGVDNGLTKVLNTMLSSSNSNFDIDLKLQSENQTDPVEIKSQILLSMPTESNNEQVIKQTSLDDTNESDSLKLALKGNVKFNTSKVDYDISYINNYVYAQIGDLKLKTETNNMLEDVNVILNFGLFKKFGIDLSLPDLSGFEFSPALLTSLASNLEENDIDDITKEIKFNLMGYGNVCLVTDMDYNLKNIKLDEFNFNGTTLTGNVEADLKDTENVINEPENKEEMTDLTGLTKFLSVVDNLVTKGKASGKASLDLLGTNLSADYSVDFEDLSNIKFYVSSVVANKDFEIVYTDHNAYLSYDNCKYSFVGPFDFTEISNAFRFYMDKLGISLPEGELKDLLDSINVSDLNDLLKQIANLKVDENGLIYTNNGLTISLPIVNGEFDYLTIDFKDYLHLNIDLNNTIEIPEVDSSQYKNMLDEELFSKLHQQLIVNKNLSLKAETVINNVPFDIWLKADFNDNVKVQLGVNIYNKDLVLTAIGDTLYLEIDNILKAKGTTKDIADLIKSLNFNEINLGEIDLDTIKYAIYMLFKNPEVDLSFLQVNGNVNAFEVVAPNVYCKITATDYEPILYQENGNYQSISDLIEFVKMALDEASNNQIAFEFTANVDRFSLNGKLQFIDNNLSLVASINAFNKIIDLEFNNNIIYITYDGIKLKSNINDLMNLVTNISKLLNIDISSEDIADLDEFLSNLSILVSKNELNVSLQELNLKLTLNPLNLNFNYKDVISGQAKFTEPFELAEKQGYVDFNRFENVITSTIEMIVSKKYEIGVSVDKILNNRVDSSYNIDLQLDITNNLNMFAKVLGLGNELSIYCENEMIYVSYGDENGLKLAVNQSALKELIEIACNLFNIDCNNIPLLNDITTNDGFDLSKLKSLIPAITIDDIPKYLEYIKEINLTENNLVIVINGEKLGDITNQDIVIEINFDENKISNIVINNLYLNGQTNEYYNIELNINKLANVQILKDKDKYIDISNTTELLTAIANTAKLTDWHIKGKVQLDINLGSLSLNAAKIDVDANIKFDDNKQPIIDIEISSYPLIGGVNNANTNGVGGTGKLLINARYRTISIYYKDGEIILKTRDEKWGAYSELIRLTKVTPMTIVNNLSYYMQYLLGFTDTIQSKIDEAIEKSQSYEGETNLGNIILGYNKSGNTHSLEINLAELAHNSDIGTLSLVLTTNNLDYLNNDLYLTKIDLDMKVLDNMIVLRTDGSGDGLYLTDLGSEADISKTLEMFEFYKNSGFALDGEYEKQGSNDYKKANTGNSEITFKNGDEVVSVVAGEIASKISFPTMENIIKDDKVTLKEYKFDGWFSDEELQTPFNLDTFPRYNTTLFAKYTLISSKTYAKISFVTNQNDVEVKEIIGFIGETFELPTLKNIEEVVDENDSILKTFLGWFDENDNEYTNNVFNEVETTLYAKWQEKTTTVCNVKVISAGNIIYNNKVEKGTTFDLSQFSEFKDSTLVYTSENFEEEYLTTDFVVSENKVWYLRNKFNFIVESQYTDANGHKYYAEYTLYEGETIDLPTFSNYEIDNSSFTTKYEFKGFKYDDLLVSGTVFTAIAKNTKIIGDWLVEDWCKVYFDVNSWAKPSWWTVSRWCKSPTNISSVSNTTNNYIMVKKGSSIKTSDYEATCECKYAVNYKFKTVAWTLDDAINLNVAAGSNNSYDSSKIDIVINENISLKPVWAQR